MKIVRLVVYKKRVINVAMLLISFTDDLIKGVLYPEMPEFYFFNVKIFLKIKFERLCIYTVKKQKFKSIKCPQGGARLHRTFQIRRLRKK